MENISKSVVSLSGERVGYVLDIAMDFVEMKKTGYFVVDEESESELFLKSEDILSISQSFVVIEDAKALEFAPQRDRSIVGKDVFDDKGNFYGNVMQLVFQKTKCTKICTTQCEILSKHIKIVGKDCVVLQFSKHKSTRQSSKIFDNVSDDRVVTIQDLQVVSKPQIVNLSDRYYIGKMSMEDVFGYNNERIISKGEIISKNIVEKAKKHNKLNQLFFAIKR